MSGTVELDLTPDLFAELSSVLADGHPCQIPIRAAAQDVLFDVPGLREPWKPCGRTGVVAHLLHSTDNCNPDRWVYVCASHDDGDWQCLKHHLPVVTVASYPIGRPSR